MEKNLEYYLQLPYTLQLIKGPDPDQPWFIQVKELPGCMSHGDTPDEAVAMIREAMELWLEGALEDGLAIPEPAPFLPDYSGKFVARVPRSLHRKLAEQAERDDVSLNAFVTAALAEAVGYSRVLSEGAAYTMPIRAPEEQLAVAESGAAYQAAAVKPEKAPRKRKLTKRPRVEE